MIDLNWDKITFAAACRENTGMSMLDSGGVSGRQWQQPEISPDAPEIRDWRKGCSATLETSVFLDARFEIDRELQHRWQDWDSGRNLGWFDSCVEFMADSGYEQSLRGNVYNSENDLSQIFVYEVWRRPGAGGDAIYCDKDTVTVLYIHTGCDARGGYGRPLFCRSSTNYSVPVEVCAEYVAMPVDPGASGVDWDHFRDIDEHWSAGYSSFPYAQLENDVEVWHEETRDWDSVEVTLKTGERVCVQAISPYVGN